MVSSEQLLDEFGRGRSEAAFREIVERHINLVFATALRAANGDAHFARDVAQVVFRDLALKAGKIPAGTLVAGWLYRHASFTAAKMLRSERRRMVREKTAVEYQSMSAPADFGERLDPALEKLGEEDRTAIVLRFLEPLSFRQVGESLGVSEDAAQKRVSRALEKLRAILARDGATITASCLAAAMAAQVQSAPPGLSTGLARAVLENLTVTKTSTMTTLLSTTKAKVAFLALAAAGVAIPLSMQHRQIEELARERDALVRSVSELREQAGRAEQTMASAEMERLRRDNAELHRLRAEIGPLRERIRKLESENGSGTTAVAAEAPKASPAQVTIEARYAEIPAAAVQRLQGMGIAVPATVTEVTLVSAEKTKELEEFLKGQEGIDLLSAPRVTTLDARQARISVEENIEIQGKQFPVGQVLDVLPEVSADRRSIGLKLSGTSTEYLGVSDDGLPRFRVRQIQSEGRVRHSETLLMQARAPDDSNDGARRTLVLVQSTVIDAAGNVVLPPPE
jgi:RNA polymerase sigma factor (sigma-70 family)